MKRQASGESVETVDSNATSGGISGGSSVSGEVEQDNSEVLV